MQPPKYEVRSTKYEVREPGVGPVKPAGGIMQTQRTRRIAGVVMNLDEFVTKR